MKILAVETSSRICSVALLEDEIVRAEYNLNLGLQHSEFLLPMVERILKDSGWGFDQLEGIAVDKGPGSFTGIRIGLTAARTLAQLLDIPLAGVVSLDILAESITPDDFVVSPIINALSGEVFTALYQGEKNRWHRSVPWQICGIDSWLDRLSASRRRILFIGDATLVYEKKIKTKFGHGCISLRDNLYPQARNAGYLGRKVLLRRKGNFQSVLPLYLRRSYAEIRSASLKKSTIFQNQAPSPGNYPNRSLITHQKVKFTGHRK